MNQTLLNNRYRIIKTLGFGGFGETVLAEDTQMPSGRYCAIKQLKSATSDPQVAMLVRDRFRREAAILEELGEEHRQIPRLYAYFQENEQFYLVQEWIEGVTLSDRVAVSGPLAESEVCQLLADLLRVLDFIHSKRIIHRDLKPQNVIIRHKDGKPVLIDFGAVKEIVATTAVQQSGSGATSIVVGTPGFMPAEQAAGRPVFASDLYSLGLTGIYLLTGKTASELEIDPQTQEIIWHPQQYSISRYLAAILNRAIQSHPRDRFPTARAMLDALETRSANAGPTQATMAVSAPPSTVTPAHKQDYKPLLIGTAIAVAIALGIGVGASGIGSKPERSQPQATSQESAATPDAKSPVTTSVETLEPKTAIRNPPQYRREPEPQTVRAIAPEEAAPAPDAAAAPEVYSNPETDDPRQQQALEVATPEASAIAPTPQEVEHAAPSETSELSLTPTDPIDGENHSRPASEEPENNPRPSPEEAIENYYSTLNDRNYQDSWNQLSPEFQTEYHGQDPQSYNGFWEGVDRVDIDRVVRTEQQGDRANVDVELNYATPDGGQTSEVRNFQLIWDENNQKWLIDDSNLN
ncbi:protein kinase [Oxynema sp. CENA135]|uniref:serine/threonine-protein kinase n=1 Tax=Oxynema sp. CENA135 TaxID=984206 RepID=UPI00190D5697|nr:serine/threonine-protein kinase [Oxynema sp. CENA135]MBK4732963.1 protein kinase [Oxynema sp. CENA135]